MLFCPLSFPQQTAVLPDVISCSAAISACGRCQQRLRTQWSRLCYWLHGNCKLRSLPVGFDAQSLSKDSPLEVVVSPTSPVESPAQEVPQLPIASLEELSTALGTEVISSAVVGAEPGLPTPTSIALRASEDEWAEETGSDGDHDFAGNASAFELLDSSAFGVEAVDESAAALFDRQHPIVVPSDADSRLVFQHRSRRTVHFGHISSEAILACKTPRSAMHIQFFLVMLRIRFRSASGASHE